MITLYFASLIDETEKRTEFAVSSKQAAFYAKQNGFDKFKIHKAVFTHSEIVNTINNALKSHP